MAVKIPNGKVHSISTGYGALLTVTAATNATETVLTVTNTLAVGDIVEVNLGWARLSGIAFRVKTATGTNVTLEGSDANTTDLNIFPAGLGTGTIRKITAWTQFSQTMTLATSGGEPNKFEYGFVEDIGFKRSITTGSSAITYDMTFADDQLLSWYEPLKAASRSNANVTLRSVHPSGSIMLVNATVFFQVIPSQDIDQIETVSASFSINGLPVRYAV